MITRFPKLLLIPAMVVAAGCQWRCAITGNEGKTGSEAVSTELVVKAEPVMRQEWTAVVPISGSLRTRSAVDVKPEVGGRLIAVYFEEGDLVRKDQLVAEIDPVNYRLAYDQAAAAVTVAEAGLERAKVAAQHARTEKERADNLLRSGGITQKDHDAAATGVREAETQVRLAEAQVGQARAGLAVADKALKDCEIFAPAQGHVQERYLDRGSLLVPGVAILKLVDNSRLELECDIPSYQLGAIRIGQHASFNTPTWGDRRFEGVVSSINPVIESDNRSARVNMKIANPGGELRSGMYARGEIVTGREKAALVIPRDALIPEEEGSGKAGVFVVREGKARRADIQIGDSRQDRVWVRQGLSEGDLVITEIGPSLKEGTPVRIK
jgi:RND family efflux transporter MFP subunit